MHIRSTGGQVAVNLLNTEKMISHPVIPEALPSLSRGGTGDSMTSSQDSISSATTEIIAFSPDKGYYPHEAIRLKRKIDGILHNLSIIFTIYFFISIFIIST